MKKKHQVVVEVEKKKYPIGAEHYELFEEIGQGVSATVHRALCKPFNETVAIKILDFERENADLNNISREAQTMNLIDHPNVLKSHCTFVSDHNLWFVMPYMAGGSCLHILKAAYPDGFEEVIIATILREVLKGLEYLHQQGHIHRDIKAGNILIDGHGAVKLGDFGVSACLFDSGDRQRTRNTFVGTPCWMAPEVMEQLHGYDFKADIWSFGITALELAHGHAPFSKFPPMKVLLMTLQHAPPGLDYERDKKFSHSFKEMIANCLVKDPSKRPTAKKLLKHSFFRQARSNDYILRKLLDGLPALGDRIKALKIKEEDMLAQEKMPHGRMEEISQHEYKRGISTWNFNLDDVKAQASLIQDSDDSIDDNIGCSNSFCTIDEHDMPSSSQRENPSQISATDSADEMQNKSASVPINGPTLNGTKSKYEDHDSGVTSSSYRQDVSQDSSSLVDNQVNHNMDEKFNRQNSGRSVDGTSIHSHRGRFAMSVPLEVATPSIQGEREKPQHQPQNNLNCNATTVPLTIDDVHSELSSKASKLSVASSDDNDEKAKVPVVQQKGRFKVTVRFENVDEKAGPSSPVQQKDQP